jgi:hypothetical protein
LHLIAELKVEDVSAQPPLPVKCNDRSLLAKLWPVVEDEVQREFARNAVDAATEPAPAADPLAYPLRRVPHDWRPAPPPAAVVWQPPVALETERDISVEFSWAGETARHVGNVVHQLLQQIAQQGLKAWGEERIAQQSALVRAALQLEGVADAELARAHERVLEALRNTIDDPRGRWLLSEAHRDARCEYRLAGQLDGVLINVTLDRTFIDDKGVRWIVDYKTSVHEGAGMAAFLDRELERYRPQLERYARLFARIETRPLRLGLYFPLLNGWREWPAGERQMRLPI